MPPPDPKFGANPVKPDLKIRAVKGRLVIMVGVWSTPVNDIMVFGSPPRRAGQGPGGNYAFLGLPPPSRNGEVDITELHLVKLSDWLRLRSPQYHVAAHAEFRIRAHPDTATGARVSSVAAAPTIRSCCNVSKPIPLRTCCG